MLTNEIIEIKPFIPAIIKIPMYDVSVMFIFGGDVIKNGIDAIQKRNDLEPAETLDIVSRIVNTGGYSLTISCEGVEDIHLVTVFMDTYDEFMCTLSHEIAHVSLKICKMIGYNPVKEQEPFCYLTGWLTREAVREFTRYKNEVHHD